MKKILALALALILALGCMIACTRTNGQSSDKTVVAIVVAGQFGDRSFYDSSKAGGEEGFRERRGQDRRVQRREL